MDKFSLKLAKPMPQQPITEVFPGVAVIHASIDLLEGKITYDSVSCSITYGKFIENMLFTGEQLAAMDAKDIPGSIRNIILQYVEGKDDMSEVIQNDPKEAAVMDGTLEVKKEVT